MISSSVSLSKFVREVLLSSHRFVWSFVESLDVVSVDSVEFDGYRVPSLLRGGIFESVGFLIGVQDSGSEGSVESLSEGPGDHVVVGRQSGFANCESEFVDVFFGCSVSLTDVIEFPDGFFLLVFVEEGGLEGFEKICLRWPDVRFVGLFDRRLDVVLLPSLSFSFAHVREDENDLLFVGREVLVGASFKEEVACVDEVIDLSSVSVKWFGSLEVALSFMVNFHSEVSSWCHIGDRFGFWIR